MNAEAWRWGELNGPQSKKVNGGAGNMGGHLYISAREVARFGWLFLNGGIWGGKRLVADEWVSEATSVQVPAETPYGFEDSAEGAGVYGYNWWLNGVKPDGERKWPEAPAGTFAASGYNNNDLFVIPEWGMVVARLGLDQRSGMISDADHSEFLGMVGAARQDA
jgi:CubicO group peptidase (beta-lactamase class C family)